MPKLLAYTVVSDDYSEGAAGNVNVSGSPATYSVSVDKNQVGDTLLNGDPKLFSFLDAGSDLRLLLGQYEWGGAPIGFRVYDTSGTNPWTPVAGPVSWAQAVNAYGAVRVGDYLYVIDFDGANVVQVKLTAPNQWTQTAYYHFPDTPARVHAGVAITAIGTDVFALFVTAADDTFSTYYDSTVVKLSTTGSFPPASPPTATVGKNAFTLTPFDGKLYVACVGGPQQAGTPNDLQSRLNVVNPSGSMSVATPFITDVNGSPAIPGDFRDIVFSDSGDAYVLIGYYDNTFSNLNYKLYKTSAASINSGSPSLGTKIFDTAAPGYLWAILYQDSANDLFWFTRGNQIQILQAPLTTSPTIVDTLDPAELGNNPINANLNSVTPLWAPSAFAMRAAAPAAPASRSLAAHARLAREARKAAKALRDKKSE